MAVAALISAIGTNQKYCSQVNPSRDRWDETAGSPWTAISCETHSMRCRGEPAMKQDIKTEKQMDVETIGIDLGDKMRRYCIVNPDGGVVEEGSFGNHVSWIKA